MLFCIFPFIKSGDRFSWAVFAFLISQEITVSRSTRLSFTSLTRSPSPSPLLYVFMNGKFFFTAFFLLFLDLGRLWWFFVMKNWYTRNNFHSWARERGETSKELMNEPRRSRRKKLLLRPFISSSLSLSTAVGVFSFLGTIERRSLWWSQMEASTTKTRIPGKGRQFLRTTLWGFSTSSRLYRVTIHAERSHTFELRRSDNAWIFHRKTCRCHEIASSILCTHASCSCEKAFISRQVINISALDGSLASLFAFILSPSMPLFAGTVYLLRVRFIFSQILLFKLPQQWGPPWS